MLDADSIKDSQFYSEIRRLFNVALCGGCDPRDASICYFVLCCVVLCCDCFLFCCALLYSAVLCCVLLFVVTFVE